MKIQWIIVRHAKAEDKEDFAQTGLCDELRPLTKKGEKEMLEVVQCLKGLVPDLAGILVSPLMRAQQTAKILLAVFKKAQWLDETTLQPGTSSVKTWSAMKSFQNFLAKKRKDEDLQIAVVGHEPELGQLISYLIFNKSEMCVPLKKGGFAIIEFDEVVQPGHGRLACLLQPSQVKKICP